MGKWILPTSFLLLVAITPAAAECSRATTTAIADLRAGLVPENRPVTSEGIVTAVFTGRDRLGGFFLQDSGDPPAGIFVYAPSLGDGEARPGRRLQVDGRFSRFHDRPQISRISALRDCGQALAPPPVSLQLPRDASRLRDLQDVKVRFEQALTVTGNRELQRHGTLLLSAGGRLRHPGESSRVNNGSDRARTILLDDGSYRANRNPTPYLDPDGTRRAGDTVAALTGVLTHAFEAYRVHPTAEPVFAAANPRPQPPSDPTGTLRVAALNAENQFLTLGSRGAANPGERARQLEKLAAALRKLDADVISLSEIENHRAALAGLVTRLNASVPAEGRYRAVDHPHPGRDAIQVAMLYRPARIDLVGTDADRDPVHNRPPLLAWFRSPESGSTLGVAAIHFKAKVGCPPHGDIDRGQGCWNTLRIEQARRLVQWIDSIRPEHAPVLIAGDVNAYAAEDPTVLLQAAGKVNLAVRHVPESRRYTYVFHGQAGQLDYLLAGAAIAERTVRSGIWHINADEPSFLGYQGQRPAPGPWRSSDHDPVWADIDWP